MSSISTSSPGVCFFNVRVSGSNDLCFTTGSSLGAAHYQYGDRPGRQNRRTQPRLPPHRPCASAEQSTSLCAPQMRPRETFWNVGRVTGPRWGLGESACGWGNEQPASGATSSRVQRVADSASRSRKAQRSASSRVSARALRVLTVIRRRLGDTLSHRKSGHSA